MPTAPKKPCTGDPTCRYLVDDCPKHGKTAKRKAYDQARGSSVERGYGDPQWRANRAYVLQRDPWCTWGSLLRDRKPAYTCGRVSTTAAHIIPRAEGGSDDPENLRGLCSAHHSSETSRGESWNKPR